MDYTAFKLALHESRRDRSQVDVAARLLPSYLAYINSTTWSPVTVMGLFKYLGAFGRFCGCRERRSFPVWRVVALSSNTVVCTSEGVYFPSQSKCDK